MKVFISHKQEDATVAQRISLTLKCLNVDCYLDVLDASLSGDGKQLTDHIKRALNDCTDILVVMSEKTRYSQWVPFEIGMSAQIDMPTVTYLNAEVALPDFLSYWPRLRSVSDIDKYVSVRQHTKDEIERRYSGRHYVTAADRNAEETRTFYSNLKTALR